MKNPTIDRFLSCKVVAIAGVSKNADQPANYIYKKFEEGGYETYALNPKAEEAKIQPCYPSLESLPKKPDAVVIATPAQVALDICKACKDQGIGLVWMHRSFGTGSFSQEALDYCLANGIEVIAGGCPMMFLKPVDFAHKCFRWIFSSYWKPQTAA